MRHCSFAGVLVCMSPDLPVGVVNLGLVTIMKLSILQYDEATQQCQLTLTKAPWAGRGFTGEMRVCDKPTCDCGEIDFTLQPTPTTTQPGDPSEFCFTLDTLEGRVSSLPDHDMLAKDRSLAEAVASELTDADWEELFNLLIETKYDAIENVDPTTLDLSPPFTFDVGDNGLAAFSSVFPYGYLGSVSCGQHSWMVEDLYCVDPDCECHEVLLTFVPEDIEDASDTQCPTFFYDYKSRKIGQVVQGAMAGQGTVEELVAQARELRDEFDVELENRHLTLRVLYVRSQAEAPTLKPEVSTSAKIKRNDPCPCGSGMKYKKCCGTMEPEE